ncbi:SMI1/KNR4 family protein [Thalassoroseus pseudoceratinae]|uniref:SMI1/KNR4 family protein n=1 Tax=Thalassoroseus pseudoceratinae TaxID=2713176 RepID=UPI00141FA7FB|nr:SMI1/KNR4 family protein [Thalassoroseus pseudoceratinae]
MIETIENLFSALQSSGFVTNLEVEPPLREVPSHIAEIPLPTQLIEFYHNVAGRIHGRYCRSLQPEDQDRFGASFLGDQLIGGPQLFSPDELISTKIEMLRWALESWVVEDADERMCWTLSIPFAAMANGDYLAFDEYEQVVYLDSDGESFILEADFGEFWEKWERLFFIGPELWMFEPFWSEYGLIIGNLENVARFREVFQSLLEPSPIS